MGPEKIAATGTSDRLSADIDDGMLKGMPIPGPQENTERSSLDETQGEAVRLIGIALWRERRHTEKLLKGQLLAIKTEIGLLAEKMSVKLEDIDTSVGLIAEELVRRSNDPPSKGTGS